MKPIHDIIFSNVFYFHLQFSPQVFNPLAAGWHVSLQAPLALRPSVSRGLP
jgi:hypothetical protein